MNANPQASGRGFSLLELLMVLVLVALVSTTVMVRWSGVRQDAVLKSAVRQLEFWDAHLRRYARSHGTQCSLLFDIQKNRVRKQYHNDSQKNPPWESLGRNIHIQQLQMPSRSSRKNQVGLLYQRDGMSTTYGVELIGPGDQHVWLLVAGVSGQVTHLESKKEYEAAFQILSAQQ